MPVNAGYEYFAAEKKYFSAKTIDEQILCMQEMIRTAPKHKSSESFVANLKQRLKKLEEKKYKASKSGKTTRKSIRKEGYQCILLGFTNSGKSSLLAKLTNARPLTTDYQFATSEPEIGTLDHDGIKAQIIDLPSIGSEYFDIGIVNTADCILIVLENLEDLEKITPYTIKAYGKKIIIINKSDLFNEQELRKLEEKIKSKKLNAVITSCFTGFNIEKLKQRIMQEMGIIRVYTKEPGKPASSDPIVLPLNSTVKYAAEKILKGFSKKIKETHVTGPSSKFPNQKVGLSHVLKDKDIIEFHTN